jgi:hypothetical protein
LSVARWPFGIVLRLIGVVSDRGTADFLRARSATRFHVRKSAALRTVRAREKRQVSGPRPADSVITVHHSLTACLWIPTAPVAARLLPDASDGPRSLETHIVCRVGTPLGWPPSRDRSVGRDPASGAARQRRRRRRTPLNSNARRTTMISTHNHPDPEPFELTLLSPTQANNSPASRPCPPASLPRCAAYLPAGSA